MSTYKGFDTVVLSKPQRSFFDQSHGRSIPARMGQLIPVMCKEALPGDTFKFNTQIFVRLLALLAPIYAMIECYVHCFFVPNRLLWIDWENFITTGQEGLGVSEQPIPPFYNVNLVLNEELNYLDENSLADYLGVPTIADTDEASWDDTDDSQAIDALPFVAYQRIWYDYYRDRNYVDDNVFDFPVASGTNPSYDMLKIQQRGWAADYFTTAMTSTQRGSQVLMPIGGDLDVSYLPASKIYRDDGTDIPAEAGGAGSELRGGRTAGGSNPQNLSFFNVAGGNLAQDARIENIDAVEFTGSTITINDFRAAIQLQAWLERNLIAGSRYTESIQAHFGVRPQDSRLQRAEYLGGGRIPIKISEVVSTAWANDGINAIPQANLAGHGIGRGDSNSVSYYVQEHGFVMCILSILPNAQYKQGLPRMFRRRFFDDYVFPTFARLGEQPVYKWELFVNPTTLTADSENQEYPVFGYQSRYADWKWEATTVHGEFKSSLSFWTLARQFLDVPVLGNTFVNFEDALQDQIFAVTGNNFLVNVYNRLGITRALPYFSVPAHF